METHYYLNIPVYFKLEVDKDTLSEKFAPIGWLTLGKVDYEAPDPSKGINIAYGNHQFTLERVDNTSKRVMLNRNDHELYNSLGLNGRKITMAGYAKLRQGYYVFTPFNIALLKLSQSSL